MILVKQIVYCYEIQQIINHKIYLITQGRFKTMNAKTIGLAIAVIGLIMTLYTGFTYVTREKIVDIGSVEITADKDHTATWSPFIGIGIMVIGGVVFLFGKKSK